MAQPRIHRRPLWSEWIADPAFATEVATLEHNNVVREADYLPEKAADAGQHLRNRSLRFILTR
jgi:hypothetical protein